MLLPPRTALDAHPEAVIEWAPAMAQRGPQRRLGIGLVMGIVTVLSATALPVRADGPAGSGGKAEEELVRPIFQMPDTPPQADREWDQRVTVAVAELKKQFKSAKMPTQFFLPSRFHPVSPYGLSPLTSKISTEFLFPSKFGPITPTGLSHFPPILPTVSIQVQPLVASLVEVPCRDLVDQGVLTEDQAVTVTYLYEVAYESYQAAVRRPPTADGSLNRELTRIQTEREKNLRRTLPPEKVEAVINHLAPHALP